MCSPDEKDDASAAEAVGSPTQKSRPLTVTEYPADIARFASAKKDTEGASKLKIGRPVPDTDPTVTLTLPKMSPKLFDRQLTVVADVHDDVRHDPRSPPPPRDSPAVAVGSPTPKSRPLTVSDAYPLCGAFSRASEAAAESKLNAAFIVPATPPTVTHVCTSAGTPEV